MTPFRSAPADAVPCVRCGAPRADLLDTSGDVVCAACDATVEANARFDAALRSARRAAERWMFLALLGALFGAAIIVLSMLFGALMFVYLHGDYLAELRLATVFFLSVGVVIVTVCIRKFCRIHKARP